MKEFNTIMVDIDTPIYDESKDYLLNSIDVFLCGLDGKTIEHLIDTGHRGGLGLVCSSTDLDYI